jgi:hypothetical protein
MHIFGNHRIGVIHRHIFVENHKKQAQDKKQQQAVSTSSTDFFDDLLHAN